MNIELYSYTRTRIFDGESTTEHTYVASGVYRDPLLTLMEKLARWNNAQPTWRYTLSAEDIEVAHAGGFRVGRYRLMSQRLDIVDGLLRTVHIGGGEHTNIVLEVAENFDKKLLIRV